MMNDNPYASPQIEEKPINAIICDNTFDYFKFIMEQIQQISFYLFILSCFSFGIFVGLSAPNEIVFIAGCFLVLISLFVGILDYWSLD